MLFKLLMAPLTMPISGFRFIMGQVQGMAERELMDVERIQEELLLLQVQLSDGEVTDPRVKR